MEQLQQFDMNVFIYYRFTITDNYKPSSCLAQ